MKEWLEKMRQKSELEKRTFAFWCATCITGFIFIIWALSFWTTLQGFSTDEKEGIQKQASVFQAIVNEVKSFRTEVYEAK